MARTPAIAAAAQAGIDFRVHEYEHDEAAGSYGIEAVEKLGVDAARVFKTLVVSVDGRLEVAVVPAAAQLDLKGARQARRAGRHAPRGVGNGLRRRRDQPARSAEAPASAPRLVGVRARDDLRQRRQARARDRARPARSCAPDGRARGADQSLSGAAASTTAGIPKSPSHSPGSSSSPTSSTGEPTLSRKASGGSRKPIAGVR